MATKLTSRQKEILEYLHKSSRTTGLMPSTRELQHYFGFASQTAAMSHLRALEKKGVIQRVPGKARAESLQRQLAPHHKDVSIRHRDANPKGGHAEAWRVLVGREHSPAAAQSVLERLRDKFPNAFIVPWNVE